MRCLSGLGTDAASRGIEFEPEEPSQSDPHVIEQGLEAPQGPTIDCQLFLNARDRFDDVAASLGRRRFERMSGEADAPYDQQFAGNNILVMSPTGKHYGPTWSEEEVEMLQKMLDEGIGLVQRSLKEEA